MSNFFNKIRKTLLKEGKTTNYLKYAIGEIVLVVIGILIALQINNWNENRKLQNEKHKLMIALKNEFTDNKKNLEEVIEGLSQSNRYFVKILNFSAGIETHLPIDSLRFYTSKIYYLQTLSLLTSVQEEAISSGKFELLDNHLKQLLSTFKDFNKSLNSLNDNSQPITTYSDDTIDLLATFSSLDDIYNNFFPNRIVSIHPAFKKNDEAFVAYIKLAKTYSLLFKIYNIQLANEVWTKNGLLRVTENILDEIDKELNQKQ